MIDLDRIDERYQRRTFELDGLTYTDFYVVDDLMEKDLPALLDWVKRAKPILEMASIDSNGDCLSSQRQEEAKELLAELESA